ncbi:acetylglutamate kinase [Candidatus Pelagibacter sp. HTCC7211]|uniref:acetylglutamate kinase n=1 Tax=Pelagibacter sp. (strain HTCC7211) TaxID=439493 RepID=UPI000183B711|nr:acetylglutamate kinase [Candidatus Pelagibacter sp. HTCC7211]EDZ59870.1 acetylglutamate kinase [Candidatus Pelagibacter sp. HTCC7211]MBD1151183.1 acetylglutamate kinase [Pelagibacterales bacterium SAG-MED25]
MLEIKEEELKKILPTDGPSINEVKKYLKKYNDEYIVIKCGGSVLVDNKLFDIFIKDISVLDKLGFIPIIVHGGGKRISNKLNELGIKSNFIKGLRVTEKETIEVVEQVLIEFNSEIIEALKEQQCTSQTINSRENNIMTVVQENTELGFVGTPTEINKSIIDKIVDEKKVPVIAPLGLDENNQAYNINADTAAGSIAKKIEARRLIIMSDVDGVLDSNKKLIPEINSQSIKDLINDEVVTGGMIPKINNCLDVACNGVKGVVIIDGRKNHSILFELLSDKGSGTLIRQ